MTWQTIATLRVPRTANDIEDTVQDETHQTTEEPTETSRWAQVIANPTSGGRGAPAAVPALLDTLAALGLQSEIAYTTADTSPQEIAARAADRGAALVVAVGGDGTISAVGAGLIGRDVPLGIVPLGTYNNIARSLGIAPRLEDALDVLRTGVPRRIDVGRANEHTFLEIAGVGLDARLFPHAEQIKRGRWRRVGALYRALERYRPNRLRIELADGTRIVSRPMIALVSNLPYFGVGFAVAPDATADSGDLVLSLFERFTRLELLRHFVMTLSGRRVIDPRIRVFRSSQIRVSGVARQMRFQADGTVLGRTPVLFRTDPQALTVLAPAIR